MAELRRGAGSRPWAFSTRAIVLAATRCPRASSSPRIRWYAQVRSSKAIATTSATSSSPIGGRPGRPGVRAVPGDQASVPAQKGLGSHEERRPAFLCQEPAQRTEPRPIDFAEGWPRLVAT